MFFTSISQMMTESVDLTLVIRKANGQLTVSTLPKANGLKDEAANHIIPLTLTGTPEEMDAEFLQHIMQPIRKATGLISNLMEFEKQADKAAANSKAAKDAKAKEVPMRLVGVAQQIDGVMLPQLHQRLQFPHRNIHQEKIPCLPNDLIGHNAPGHAPHLGTKALGRDGAILQLAENALLAIGVNHACCLKKAQAVKGFEATHPVQVDKHTAKIEYKVLYLLVNIHNLSYIYKRLQR